MATGDDLNIDGHTLQEALRLILTALLGDVSGAGTGTEKLYAADRSKARITAEVDCRGNRVVESDAEQGQLKMLYAPLYYGGGSASPTGSDLEIDGHNLEEALRLMTAVLVGDATGLGTPTERFKAADGSKIRVVSSVDSFGNRTVESDAEQEQLKMAFVFGFGFGFGGGSATPTGSDLEIDGHNLEEAMRVVMAVVAGDATGLGTSTEIYKAVDGSKVRVVSSVDSFGNRTVESDATQRGVCSMGFSDVFGKASPTGSDLDVDGHTLEETLRLVAAVLVGGASGLGTPTERYQAADGSKVRVVSSVDSFGNRSVESDAT